MDLQLLVVDKHEIGKESSWAGAGILFPLMPWNYEPKFIIYAKIASNFMKNFQENYMIHRDRSRI